MKNGAPLTFGITAFLLSLFSSGHPPISKRHRSPSSQGTVLDRTSEAHLAHRMVTKAAYRALTPTFRSLLTPVQSMFLPKKILSGPPPGPFSRCREGLNCLASDLCGSHLAQADHWALDRRLPRPKQQAALRPVDKV